MTIPGDQLTDIKVAPAEKKPTIEQTVGCFSFHLDGGKMITSNKMGRIINDEILERWVKWKLITGQKYVKSSNFTGSGEYNLTLAGHSRGESSILLQLVSGLTLMVIPHYTTLKFNITYELKNSKTGKIWKANIEDHFTRITGLLLLPVAPFTQGGKNITWTRMAKHLFIQFKAQ